MADENETTEEVVETPAEESVEAGSSAAAPDAVPPVAVESEGDENVPPVVAAEGDADVNADVEADADAAAAQETAPVADSGPTPVAESTPAPVKDSGPAPITETTTPTQRRETRQAAKLAASGSRAPRTVEELQAERAQVRKAKAAARRLRRGQERESYRASEHERVPTPPREHVAGLKKTRQGIVVSDKAAKTITVRIDDARPHPKYKKIVRTSMTLHAHDEANDAHIGDTVVVTESRPLSATKRWRLVQVLERAK
jgi:small subunit ribosomal protein S17